MTKLRLAFMGTPDFAVPTLRALVEVGHEVAAVYCQPPRPAGRGHKLQPSPVQRFAEEAGLPVRHPVKLIPEEAESFAALKLDVAVVAAYGLILPKSVLAAPRLGCINVHGSLLPRWRGAAPLQRAILAGDKETGITIMQMDAGLDTGPMLLKGSLPIGPRTTASELHDKLAEMGARLAVEALEGVVSGKLKPEVQPEGSTYAKKLDRDEGRIDWRRPAAELDLVVRALNPWPGVWFEIGTERVKLLEAEPVAGKGAPGTVLDGKLTVACGEGALRCLKLQRAGAKPTEAEAFLRGFAVPAGTLLPCPATS